MTKYSYLKFLFFCFMLFSCSPKIGDFFYNKPGIEEVKFKIADTIDCTLNMGNSGPWKRIDCWIDIDKLSEKYTIEDVAFYFVAKNKTDSLMVKPLMYWTHNNNNNSFNKNSAAEFNQLPDVAKRVDRRENYDYYEQFWFDIPQIHFKKYKTYELNLSITISYKGKTSSKKIKEIFIRKRRMYLRPFRMG